MISRQEHGVAMDVIGRVPAVVVQFGEPGDVLDGPPRCVQGDGKGDKAREQEEHGESLAHARRVRRRLTGTTPRPQEGAGEE